MSRRSLFTLAWSSRCPVTSWNFKLKSSSLIATSLSSSSCVVNSRSPRNPLGFNGLTHPFPREDLRPDRQLEGREPQRFFRHRLVDAGELEHHAAGFHDRDPSLRLSFARPLSRLRGLLRVRLVREHRDPDLAAALDMTRHRDARGLDLMIRDPCRFERLQAVLAEVQAVPA